MCDWRHPQFLTDQQGRRPAHILPQFWASNGDKSSPTLIGHLFHRVCANCADYNSRPAALNGCVSLPISHQNARHKLNRVLHWNFSFAEVLNSVWIPFATRVEPNLHALETAWRVDLSGLGMFTDNPAWSGIKWNQKSETSPDSKFKTGEEFRTHLNI